MVYRKKLVNKYLFSLVWRRGKKETPTLLIGDSQAVKNTDTASIETKGFCLYKSTNGIKRHLCVDTLGNIMFVACTPTNITDNKGLVQIIKANLTYFQQKPVNTAKITSPLG